MEDSVRGVGDFELHRKSVIACSVPGRLKTYHQTTFLKTCVFLERGR